MSTYSSIIYTYLLLKRNFEVNLGWLVPLYFFSSTCLGPRLPSHLQSLTALWPLLIVPTHWEMVSLGWHGFVVSDAAKMIALNSTVKIIYRGLRLLCCSLDWLMEDTASALEIIQPMEGDIGVYCCSTLYSFILQHSVGLPRVVHGFGWPMGWVWMGPDFSVFGGLGCVHCSKTTTALKGLC